MYAWKELFKYLYLLWMVTQRLAEKRVIAGPGRVIVVINLILKEPLLRETSDDITVLVKISLKRLFRFMLSIFFSIWTEKICCRPSSVGKIITSPTNEAEALPIIKLNKVKMLK